MANKEDYQKRSTNFGKQINEKNDIYIIEHRHEKQSVIASFRKLQMIHLKKKENNNILLRNY